MIMLAAKRFGTKEMISWKITAYFGVFMRKEIKIEIRFNISAVKIAVNGSKCSVFSKIPGRISLSKDPATAERVINII